MCGVGTTKTLPNSMTVITLTEFNEKFLMDYPEMAEMYHIEEEETQFDGSDTYVDLDDYEYMQTLY